MVIFLVIQKRKLTSRPIVKKYDILSAIEFGILIRLMYIKIVINRNDFALQSVIFCSSFICFLQTSGGAFDNPI